MSPFMTSAKICSAPSIPSAMKESIASPSSLSLVMSSVLSFVISSIRSSASSLNVVWARVFIPSDRASFSISAIAISASAFPLSSAERVLSSSLALASAISRSKSLILARSFRSSSSCFRRVAEALSYSVASLAISMSRLEISRFIFS